MGYKFKSIDIRVSKEAGELPDDWNRSQGEKLFLKVEISNVA